MEHAGSSGSRPLTEVAGILVQKRGEQGVSNENVRIAAGERCSEALAVPCHAWTGL